MEKKNDTVVRCDEAIRRHELLNHPFYQSWSAGTLPVGALRDYARDYGAFIGAIEGGWRCLGEVDIAGHEITHARLWETTFAAALATEVDDPKTPQVAALLAAAGECFAEPATALGALYAFEAQQPATAKSKLLGLRTHYTSLPSSCGEYFELHSADYDETTLLVDRMGRLDVASAERAVSACERMSAALYGALTGIHAPHVSHGSN